MEIITGESMERQLQTWGIDCLFLNFELAPQLTLYRFNLNDLTALNRLKRLIPSLSAWAGTLAEFAEGFSDGCHFVIKLANKEREVVSIWHFNRALELAPPFSLPFGKSDKNSYVTKTLDELPHLLIAGTTGSGKSVAINSILTGLCCNNTADSLRMVLIDFKQVEFNIFERFPHLLTDKVLTTAEEARAFLFWLVDEMERRYSILRAAGIEKNDGRFCKIVLVIDELADLILTNEELKVPLIRILQKARAAGIHVIVATQSPRAKFLDGIMLANLPARLALTCASVRESMLILGHAGAEKLQGRGDALLKLPDRVGEIRLQVPFIDRETIKNLVQ